MIEMAHLSRVTIITPTADTTRVPCCLLADYVFGNHIKARHSVVGAMPCTHTTPSWRYSSVATTFSCLKAGADAIVAPHYCQNHELQRASMRARNADNTYATLLAEMNIHGNERLNPV